MIYRVTFARRFDANGSESSIEPSNFVDPPDGVILSKTFVERFEPEAQHSQEMLDEDDAFLGSAAPEVWEYEIADAGESDFLAALERSGTVMEFDKLDDV